MDINEAIKLRKKRAFPLWQTAYQNSMRSMEKAKEGNRAEREKKQKGYEWEMNKAINAYFKMMDCKRIDPRLDEEGDK